MNQNSIPVYVNSKERENGTIGDFDILLPTLQQTNENYEILLNNLRITNDFFNIHEYNNVIEIGTTENITIPPNHYTSTQFTDYFNNNSLGITCDYDTQEHALNFYNNSGTTYAITVNENQKYLGLTPGDYVLGPTLSSDIPADFSGTNTIKSLLIYRY